MKLYSDSSGEILRFLQTQEEETRYSNPPEGATYTLEFDEDTNSVLIQSLRVALWEHKLIGGVVTRQGQVITVNTPGQFFQDKQALLAIWTALKNGQALTQAQHLQFHRFEAKALLKLMGQILE